MRRRTAPAWPACPPLSKRCCAIPPSPAVHLKRCNTSNKRGGKLTPALIDELIAAAPDAQLHVMYGQTEATARLSSLPPALLQAKPGSIGKGIPGVQLRVVDANGQDVNPGKTGEIIARGQNISPGYWRDPEATAQKFVNGALHTGDVGTVDEEGYIYIVDRTADFIKSYGHRVSSQQIEACVMELADVVSAAAIGMPDETRGEAIAVFITLRAGATLPTERVLAHCTQRLPRHMWPKDVFVLAALPMNPSGKVVKAELKKLCAALPVAST
ncbi:MAG: long-chain fatty acid--CoA ligase [Anaerolineae bacterium]|nr:long-chain fatty acid--CoA ligase [Anaerolineae bacterium]